jgi:hypothetical protein
MSVKREFSSSASDSDHELSTPKKKFRANNTQHSPKNSPVHKWTDDEIRTIVELRNQGLTNGYFSIAGNA